MLCPRCNVALSYVEDSELMANLEAYLAYFGGGTN